MLSFLVKGSYKGKSESSKAALICLHNAIREEGSGKTWISYHTRIWVIKKICCFHVFSFWHMMVRIQLLCIWIPVLCHFMFVELNVFLLYLLWPVSFGIWWKLLFDEWHIFYRLLICIATSLITLLFHPRTGRVFFDVSMM